MNNEENNGRRNLWRSLFIALVIVVLYAYAVQVTDINLEEPLEPRRQENLISLLRSLARPDLFEYDDQTRSTNLTIRMPCPEEPKASQITVENRLVLMIPNCATTTQDEVTLRGEGFQPNVSGIVRWYPEGSTTTRALSSVKANAQGNFEISFTLPDIRPSEEPQRIEIVEITNRQIAGLSDTVDITLDRILETILMALMASTIGTILAVPISFLAARNLMAIVGAPLAAIMSAIVAIPVGGLVGSLVASWVAGFAEQVSSPTILGIGAVAVSSALIWPVIRLGSMLLGEDSSAGTKRILRIGRVTLIILLAFFSLANLTHLGVTFGEWLEPRLGAFGFVGYFFFVLSDVLRLSLPLLIGFAGALAAASLGSRFGQEAIFRLPSGRAQTLTALTTFLGTALFVFGLLYTLNWICFLGRCPAAPEETSQQLLRLGGPAGIVGLVAGLLSLMVAPERSFPIGMIVYTVTRSTLNILRSLEPVILGTVFVVWVGIGPFAGVLALVLHSIADLGKLFSEQVENISEGPVEAVTATGANRLQTIVFAVVPQVVPHYMAFTFYRWDINVRMSTIIGFVGGGGIGLVLQRSTNQLLYRRASVMVLAIAIVVTLLDYVSSKLRTRVI